MITLLRDTFTPTSTISELLMDDEFLCDALEDTVRDGDDDILQPEEKVYGATAIPIGTYEIVLHHWDRYGCKMPLLLNVPLYQGVYIHPGNGPKDTLGCILVGERTGGMADFIAKSRVIFFERVLPRIHDWLDDQKLFISIRSASKASGAR